MEKYSQQKGVDVEGTSTSITDGLLLNPSQDVDCQKCHSSDINTMYVAGHDVLHCICNQCGYEWVE